MVASRGQNEVIRGTRDQLPAVYYAVRDLFLQCDAVLFDVDGTLIDSSIDFAELSRAVENYGRQRDLPIPVEPMDAISLIYFWEDGLINRNHVEEGMQVRFETFKLMEQLEMPACIGAAPVDGACELLEVLRGQGKRIGFVTRNSQELGYQMLEDAQLRQHLDALVGRDFVRRCKPDPQHLLSALGYLEVMNSYEKLVFQPNRTIMIGDHWTDAAAGNAAGMTTIGLLLGRPDDIFAQARPTYVVNTLRDVLHAAHG